jgi:NADH:ubiquinone oxidoreductase subunit D
MKTNWIRGFGPGTFRLNLEMESDIITHATVDRGYCTKNWEKVACSDAWFRVLPFLDHFDPENAWIHEGLWVECIEGLSGNKPDLQTLEFRKILFRLGDVTQLLAHLSRIARKVSSEVLSEQLTLELEKILDLMEMLAGSRWAFHFFGVKGFRDSVSEGFLDKIRERLEGLEREIPKYQGLFFFSQEFEDRCRETGILTATALSGLSSAKFLIESADSTGTSTTYSRYRQMFELLKQNAHEVVDRMSRIHLPLSPKMAIDEIYLSANKAKVSETYFRGQVTLEVEADGSDRIKTAKWTTPSQEIFKVLPVGLERMEIEDLPLFLGSLAFSISEVDQ